MKKIEAIIRRSKFSEVKKALRSIDVNFFTYWDVTGVGNEKEGHIYRGVRYSSSDIQRRYLVIVVRNVFVKRTVETILKATQTGTKGDGRIFVTDVTNVYRIRTGESGEDILKS